MQGPQQIWTNRDIK